jgi:hypothetical protein
MNVLYLALSTARARHVRHDTDFLVGRNVTVDLIVSPADDWTPYALDPRVRTHAYEPPKPSRFPRLSRRRRPALPGTAVPHVVVIGGAASLPYAQRLADAYPGLSLTFELDWADPAFAGLPGADPDLPPEPQGADR